MASLLTKFNFSKTSTWFVLLGIIIVLLFTVRACTHHKSHHKDIYVIGRDSSWYPLQLLGRDRNLIGFTNDLMAMIAKQTETSIIWFETNPNTLVSGLDDENYDAILSSMKPNILNEEKYVFSDLLFKLGPVLIVREDSQITSLKELQGQSVGMGSSSFIIYDAIRASGAAHFEINLINYDNMNQALDALVNNQIDGVLMEALPAYTMTKGFYAGKLKVVSPPIDDEGLRIIALKTDNSKALIEDFNKAFETLEANGEYAKLIAKWDLIDTNKQYWHKDTK